MQRENCEIKKNITNEINIFENENLHARAQILITYICFSFRLRGFFEKQFRET